MTQEWNTLCLHVTLACKGCANTLILYFHMALCATTRADKRARPDTKIRLGKPVADGKGSATNSRWLASPSFLFSSETYCLKRIYRQVTGTKHFNRNWLLNYIVFANLPESFSNTVSQQQNRDWLCIFFFYKLPFLNSNKHNFHISRAKIRYFSWEHLKHCTRASQLSKISVSPAHTLHRTVRVLILKAISYGVSPGRYSCENEATI